MERACIIHQYNVDKWAGVLEKLFSWNGNCNLSILILDGENQDRAKLSHFMIMHPFAQRFNENESSENCANYFQIKLYFLSPFNSEKCKEFLYNIDGTKNYMALFWHKHQKSHDFVRAKIGKFYDWNVPIFKRVFIIEVFCNLAGNVGLISLLETHSARYIDKTDFSKFARPNASYYLI